MCIYMFMCIGVDDGIMKLLRVVVCCMSVCALEYGYLIELGFVVVESGVLVCEEGWRQNCNIHQEILEESARVKEGAEIPQGRNRFLHQLAQECSVGVALS